ncbi:MAG: helix-hairpin-helix domain-containing protein [Anaerolineales bacterium]|nr:helix-hairpin-helix domain-containing protein [Chloroflexota bacterium]MBL6981406.1 helix-hairpin-helix domain-containing protein [Anaerolineales bacterium]
MKNWWLVALGVLFGLLGAGAVILASSPPRGTSISLLPPPTPAPIMVHITGAVSNPGVYDLPLDSRVQDAIFAAGGFADDAQIDGVNLAAKLQDGDQVQIPTQRTSALPETGSESSQNSGEQSSGTSTFSIVNINTASQAELETLPGIGPVTAEKIIEYRQTRGGFPRIEEIQKVSGIGPATFEKIKDQITVSE